MVFLKIIKSLNDLIHLTTVSFLNIINPTTATFRIQWKAQKRLTYPRGRYCCSQQSFLLSHHLLIWIWLNSSLFLLLPLAPKEKWAKKNPNFKTEVIYHRLHSFPLFNSLMDLKTVFGSLGAIGPIWFKCCAFSFTSQTFFWTVWLSGYLRDLKITAVRALSFVILNWD